MRYTGINYFGRVQVLNIEDLPRTLAIQKAPRVQTFSTERAYERTELFECPVRRRRYSTCIYR